MCFVNMEKYCTLYKSCINNLKNDALLYPCVLTTTKFSALKGKLMYMLTEVQESQIHNEKNARLINHAN